MERPFYEFHCDFMWKKIPPGTTSAPGATSASGIWTVDPDWGCALWRDELNRANAHFPSTGMNAVGFLPTWRGASAHRRLPSRAMAATHRACEKYFDCTARGIEYSHFQGDPASFPCLQAGRR